MEGASHCVYLGCIFAQSLALLSLDWILTFSSFRFRFPCAVFKVHARLPQPFGLSQLRGCGTVVSSPLVEPLGSPSVRPRPVATVAYRFRVFEASFPILQNDTVFQSRFQSDSCPFGPTELSVVLWYLYHFFLLRLCFRFIEARPRIRFALANHFSLERR